MQVTKKHEIELLKLLESVSVGYCAPPNICAKCVLEPFLESNPKWNQVDCFKIIHILLNRRTIHLL